jgi:phosphopentomutase
MINRVILVVMDSVGVGELPDADIYGDQGSNTLGNIYNKMPNLNLKNLTSIGLGNIDGLNIPKVENPIGAYGKALELSPGKDTTTGHWEIAGIKLEKAFPTYPDGFPQSIIAQFEQLIGTKTIANEVASGTEIISRLGDEHVRTGYPIVYTSADSVFQIAAHEDVIPLEKLYDMCRAARKMLTGEHAVGRVIARPFTGTSGNYKRTLNRSDFSLLPISKTMLDVIKENDLSVMAVGKIEDIFAGIGVTEAVHTKGNMDGVDKTLEYLKTNKNGLIFTNLVDFDMSYGHRNDYIGYGNALQEFDDRLPEIMSSMQETDVLIITADHGCDPTTASTDHSREYIPVLVYGKRVKPGINIGIRRGFGDIAATILDLLDLPMVTGGKSFKEEII